jgi:TonB family protein
MQHEHRSDEESIMTVTAFLLPLLASTAQPAVMQGGWISDADYPAAARDAGQQGVVRVRFQISPQGNVGACTTTETSGSAALDVRTCEIITQRFRFAAARDGDGKPVSEWRSQKISWKLPAEAVASAMSAAQLKADVKVDVAKDGTIDSCEVIKPSGDTKFDNVACMYLTRRGKVEPKRNAKGKGIRSVQIVPVWK